MKTRFPFILIAVMLSVKLYGQNTYDPYRLGNSSCPYEAIGPDDPNGGTFSDISESVFGSFDGEYQIFLYGIHPINSWYDPSPTPANAISYKIELVSFPFTTNCYSCQGTQSLSINAAAGFGATSPSDDRTLVMPNDQFPYSSSENAWVRDLTHPAFLASMPPPAPGSTTYEYKFRRVFEGAYYAGTGGTDGATLASRSLTLSLPYEYHPVNRVIYPHSVLKHTLYVHANSSLSSEILDSISFILDHTRGRMSYYPFVPTYSTPATTADHDITIFPSVVSPTSWDNSPNFDNSNLTNDGIQTINYFPFNTSSQTSPLRPIPYSLVQAFLANNNGSAAAGYTSSHVALPGIKQTYVIDQPIDITLINPSEKIIYNPSDVSIDLARSSNLTGNYTLTFPSGYTFKTVSGVYPTKAQVFASDPNNLHFHPQDINANTTLKPTCDNEGAIGDGVYSYYRVKNGSTLIIEPCVRLYDVKIEVETGAHLYYNPTEISGNNYSIVSTGGTIHYPTVGTPIYSACPFNCYEVSRYDETNLIINTNTTWTPTNILTALDATGDGHIQIAGTITVQSGNTLNINGPVKIEFGENGRILVERNAKLIINGSGIGNEVVLTSAEFCNKSMWQGIQVLGNQFAVQGTPISPSSNQGYLLLNRAIIENARVAVKFGIDGNNSNNGGVLNASLSTFRNNFVDIEFKPYNSFVVSPTGGVTALNYAAQIGNCIFETTRQLNDPYYLKEGARPIGSDKHIILNGVRYVKILANKFQNTATNSLGEPFFDADVRGTGIYSIDSYVALNSGILSNTFAGLSEGFWGVSTGALRYISINGNHFYNNIHGVVLEGTELSSINSNDFTIPASSNNPLLLSNSLTRGYNKPVGLYLIGATDFTAQENNFDKYLASSPSGITSEKFNYGMVVNNCTGSDYSPIGVGPGDGIGYVYKNKFSYLNVDLQSELDNKGNFSPTNSAGLEFKCNEFYNRINNDIVITGKNASEFGNVRDQGICDPLDTKTPAGNQFYTSACATEEQIMTAYTDPTSYGAILYSPHSGAITSPICYNSFNVNVEPPCVPPFDATNSCPSNITSMCLGDISCLYASYNSAVTKADQKLTAYKQLIDGGNTTLLISAINNPSVSAGSLKNLLLSKSPYLSDEVLIATLNRQDLPPYGHLEQIFIANSPVTKPVITALNNVGLPSGILNNIMSAQLGISARKEKESEVDYYSFQLSLSKVLLKQAYLGIDNLDSLKKFALKDTTLAGLFKLMPVLMNNCDYIGAQSCLNHIISKETVPSDKTKLHTIRMELEQQNKTWNEMDSTQYEAIKSIYFNNPETAINARVILAAAKQFQYPRFPFDIPSGVRAFTPINSNMENEDANGLLMNYPNPFTDETVIKAILPEDKLNGELIVTDVLGKIIAKYNLVIGENSIMIDNSDLRNGIYFYYMLANGVMIKSNKMIRTK